MKKSIIPLFLISVILISWCWNKSENEFAMAEKCHNYSEEFNQRINNEWEWSYNYEIIESNVFYSNKLNSCIWKYEILQNDSRYNLMRDILKWEDIYQCKDWMRWYDSLWIRKDDEHQKEDCLYSNGKVIDYLK